MDPTILKQFITCILQPYLHNNIISIVNSYNNPLYHFVLVHYNGESSFRNNNRKMCVDTVFQACSIEDVLKYIIYSYKHSEKIFVRYIIGLTSLHNRFLKELHINEKEHFNDDTCDFFITMPEKKERVLLLAQELYGNNPQLFFKDMRYMQEERFINCFSLIQYNNLFRRVKIALSPLLYSKCDCVNIYTNHTMIFNFNKYDSDNNSDNDSDSDNNSDNDCDNDNKRFTLIKHLKL